MAQLGKQRAEEQLVEGLQSAGPVEPGEAGQAVVEQLHRAVAVEVPAVELELVQELQERPQPEVEVEEPELEVEVAPLLLEVAVLEVVVVVRGLPGLAGLAV